MYIIFNLRLKTKTKDLFLKKKKNIYILKSEKVLIWFFFLQAENKS